MRLTSTVLLRLACSALLSLTCSAATPVILISVNTLRADHLGRNTPHIDALAKNGTVFSQATTPYPLTLPAHTALLTSTYPFANGVLDNGIPLNSSALTLATVFKKAGYRTSAFIGSFVLDRRFGLSRDFDVYDGPLDVHNNLSAGQTERKRPGEQVAEAAKHWLEANANAPFFLFLHLYDLHAPYNLPRDPSQRHGETGYQAELAYVDQVLGDFTAFLQRRGLQQKTLIVFTSDHGEGLGDHGESSHGYFIYQSTLHVPLIIQWPPGAKRISQDRINEPLNLIDVAPTILDAVGLSRPSEMRGRSLLTGTGAEEVYSESVYARNHFGCASLRSLRMGGYKYIDAPKPELYDLAADPKEQRNLYDQQRAKASAMRERIIALRGTSPPPAAKPVTPDTAAVLRSLGYLSGSGSGNHLESKVDPKDRIADFERYVTALGSNSTSVLETLRDKLPDVVDIRMSLGLSQRRQGDDAGAAHEFKRATELDPKNAQAHFEMGLCDVRLKQRDDAIREFKTTLAFEPWYTRADEALANLYLQDKDLPQGREHLNHLLTIDPDNYTAHFNLGILAAMQQDWNEAQHQLLAAVHTDPASAEAHNTLGGVYFERGELDEARDQFKAAIRLQNKFAEAHYRLGLVYQKQGNAAEAAHEFHAAQDAAH